MRIAAFSRLHHVTRTARRARAWRPTLVSLPYQSSSPLQPPLICRSMTSKPSESSGGKELSATDLTTHKLSAEAKRAGEKAVSRTLEEVLEVQTAKGNDKIESRVRKWVREIIVGLNLCPFAERTLRGEEPLLEISVIQKKEDEDILRWVWAELMIRKDKPGTTLVVCPECYPDDFESFLSVVQALEEEILSHDDLDGILQIAPFHPLFRFQGSGDDDDGVDNWTNRSPYPIFHILREDEVQQAVDLLDGDAGKVWKRNVNLLHDIRDKMGMPAMDRLYKHELDTDEKIQLQSILRKFRVNLVRGKSDSEEGNKD
eukprot:CAMPEP_0198148618 /NCGR_PEP_ID=MMETSP1443-20131203/42353_1 /TAXON_ID=186043 /ORGANISM="Entomoneis sp., Strain CCMP2396" /LENGTH=314 /DNA_ID=CAMNT_0043813343 /DNA_START=49 /DNA_END=993 /DNA_ORIENTATION=+